MHTILAIAAAAGLTIGTATVLAQNSAQDNAPGQRMQDKGSVPGQSSRAMRPAKENCCR
jgi:hypothetical protein